MGHRQGAGVGPVLQLPALVEEGAHVDHQGGHGHQGDGEEDDEDEDGPAFIWPGAAVAEPCHGQPPHRMTPRALRVHVPLRRNGIENSKG